MKLYQALTQVTLNTQMVDDLPDFQITTVLDQPLNFAPTQLYHYIDAVLKSGSRHDENNLLYVTDAILSLKTTTLNKLNSRHLPQASKNG